MQQCYNEYVKNRKCEDVNESWKKVKHNVRNFHSEEGKTKRLDTINNT